MKKMAFSKGMNVMKKRYFLRFQLLYLVISYPKDLKKSKLIIKYFTNDMFSFTANSRSIDKANIALQTATEKKRVGSVKRKQLNIVMLVIPNMTNDAF